MIIALISKVCHELLYCNFKLQENGRAKALQPKKRWFYFVTTGVLYNKFKKITTKTCLYRDSIVDINSLIIVNIIFIK